MNKMWKHFCVISHHKIKVAQHCFHCGLIWRGLTHDLSKYGKTEFLSSARYFQGSRSPIEAEKEDRGYSLAWQHHKGHNPHHWEYWIDNVGTRENKALKIPYKYVVEMVCDWIGAGQVYSSKAWNQHEPVEYYNHVRAERIIHPETEALIYEFLNTIDQKGLKAFYKLARSKETRRKYENS